MLNNPFHLDFGYRNDLMIVGVRHMSKAIKNKNKKTVKSNQ